MSPREIFCSSLKGEIPVNTPVFLYDLSLGIDVLNVPSADVFGCGGLNGVMAGKAILALQKELKHDAAVGCYRAIDQSVFGGVTECREYGIPMLIKKPFEDPFRLYAVSPEDMEGRMDEMIRSYETVRSGSDMGMAMNMVSPFSAAASMRGLETFLMDLCTEKEYIGDLLQFENELFAVMFDELKDVDADAMLLAAPYDNVDMIDAGMMELAFRSLRNVSKTAHAEGLPLMLHPHGSFTSEHGRESLEELLMLPADCLYYGESNDHHEMRISMKGRCALAGGIDTFTTIYLGTDERVRKDVNNVMDAMKGENFIFTCSCSVDRGLSLERMRDMMEAVRAFH
jgi:Uroporphyrinogen-III decarboxylase